MEQVDSIARPEGMIMLVDRVSILARYAWHHSRDISKDMIQLFPNLYVTCARLLMLPTTPYPTMLYTLLVLLARTQSPLLPVTVLYDRRLFPWIRLRHPCPLRFLKPLAFDLFRLLLGRLADGPPKVSKYVGFDRYVTC